MRKVIGIGETILDILFQNGQPLKAVAGGSTLNCLVSLSRMGIKTAFISELGGDAVGGIIRSFLDENGIDRSHMASYEGNKSPVSLAFLSEKAEAQYSFYKDYPQERLHDVEIPEIDKDDIVLIGSYYSITPALRCKHLELLERAREKGAIVYYDPNFRKPHKSEALKLAPYILENLEYASIVRGSREDFQCLYDMEDPDKVYKEKIHFYCRNFIYTSGEGQIRLFTGSLRATYDVTPIDVVSTVGAGDNFNAGLIYALIKNGIGLDELGSLDKNQWDSLISSGQALSAQVCQCLDNYISKDFAKAFVESR